MDYCYSCRRHLNGALVCPGCAAYAPDIAPRVTDDGISPAWSAASTVTDDAPSATTTWESTAPAAWHDGPRPDEAPLGAGMDETTHPDTSGGIEGTPPARQGRAARRRQLARWKKTRRRAVVATAVALVGGGLTVATTDRHSTDQAQAADRTQAAVSDDRSMDAAEEQATERAAEQGTEHTRPASEPHTTHQSERTASPAQPQAADLPRQQSPTETPPTTRSSAPSAPAPDAAVPSRPTATPAHQAEAVSSASDTTAHDRSDTAAEQPSASADATAPGTSQPSPPPATSPTQVCLLFLCLD